MCGVYRESFRRIDSRDVFLGIRSERMHVAPALEGQTIAGRISAIESWGRETLFQGDADALDLLALSSER